MPAVRRLYDLTVPIFSGMPVWPGDPQVEMTPILRIAAGDDCNLGHLSCSHHTGTHVDAPWHFDDAGPQLDAVPLDRWVGPCYVADLSHVNHVITPEHLQAAGIPSATERLLLRTRNSRLWQSRPNQFFEDYVALTPASAHWLVDRGIQLIGIDSASVDPFENQSHAAHKILLRSGHLIVENLDLSDVGQGPYHLVCLPLNLLDADGAPARVILMDPV